MRYEVKLKGRRDGVVYASCCADAEVEAARLWGDLVRGITNATYMHRSGGELIGRKREWIKREPYDHTV